MGTARCKPGQFNRIPSRIQSGQQGSEWRTNQEWISRCRSHSGTWLLLWWHGHFAKASPRNRSFIENKYIPVWAETHLDIQSRHMQTPISRIDLKTVTPTSLSRTMYNKGNERQWINMTTYPYMTSSSESLSMENAGLSFNWESNTQDNEIDKAISNQTHLSNLIAYFSSPQESLTINGVFWGGIHKC